MKKIFLTALPCLWLACNTPAGRQPERTGSLITHSNTALYINTSVPTAADQAALKGEWVLQPVLASDTATGKRPRIQFNLSDHTFSGNTGCNNVRGIFHSTDSTLYFDKRIILTKMTCPGYDEDAFIRSLLRTNRYKIENGVLIFLFNKDELSRWTRKNYKPPLKKTI